MIDNIPDKDMAVWRELAESSKRYTHAHRTFFQGSVDRVAVIRRVLRSEDRLLAVGLAQYLRPEEHMQLFNEWVGWSRTIGCWPAVHNYILSLPRDWVLEHIEETAEPYLREADDTDINMYLLLYNALDPGLATKLARRALEHPDAEIQAIGKEFLTKQEKDKAQGGV